MVASIRAKSPAILQLLDGSRVRVLAWQDQGRQSLQKDKGHLGPWQSWLCPKILRLESYRHWVISAPFPLPLPVPTPPDIGGLDFLPRILPLLFEISKQIGSVEVLAGA